jgi:hypothetical protein
MTIQVSLRKDSPPLVRILVCQTVTRLAGLQSLSLLRAKRNSRGAGRALLIGHFTVVLTQDILQNGPAFVGQDVLCV